MLVAVTAACSSSPGGDREATETPPSTVPGLGGCLEQGATVPRDTPAGAADVHLLDVRVTRLDACADEVVFEFRSSGRALPPGYEIAYEPGPFRDFTSGAEIEPAGGAYLVIRFHRTGIFEVVTGPEGEPDFGETYDLGRESIVPSGMNHLREARIVAGPEAAIQWVIGVDSPRPFTVDASTLPMPLPPDDPAPVPEPPPPPPTVDGPASTTTTTTPPAPATARIVLTIG